MLPEDNEDRNSTAIATPEREEDAIDPKTQSHIHQSSSNWAKLKRYWWILPVIAVILAIGGVAVWRLRNNTNTETTATQPAPATVSATTATRAPIREWVSSEGNVRAVDYKHLAFEVEGDVTYLARRGDRRLREGDRVSEGELLARVDDRDLQADVRQAQAAIAEAQQQRATAMANVASARSQVQQARSQVQQAQAQLQQAQTNRNLTQSELERYRLLYNEGVIAESEFESRRSRLQDAQANVTAARAQVTAAENQVDVARAQVTAAQEQQQATESQITTAQARLTQAQVALEGASLYAPFDGVVAYLNITEGEYYNPQIVSTQLAGDYQGILERIPIVVIDPTDYEVTVDLASTSGEQVAPDQLVLIDADSSLSQSDSQQSFLESARARGEVFSVNPAISPGGRAIEATIRVTEGEQYLEHGAQVLTWIAVDNKPNAVVVPLNAVVFRDRNPYVFVINPDTNTVEQRSIELGITGINRREILAGVTAGEQVVIAGQNRLVDGAPIQIAEEFQVRNKSF
jgi:HlyD family secretion protein